MSAGAVFDDKAARKLEAIYRTPDVVAQRRSIVEALSLLPGTHALDIGCGPGFFVAEMAEAVGLTGHVAGIDKSTDMVAMAKSRCAGFGWAAITKASATALPFDDASFDAAAAVQVYLYVDDLARALSELWRVLKPGGRAAILDTDWDSVVWHTANRARMTRVLAAWEEHFADAHLASHLLPALCRAGFEIEAPRVLPLLNTQLEDASYSGGMLRVIRAFAEGRNGITREEAGAWAEELRERGRDGSYFFSLNRYLFVAQKPR